MKIFDFNVHLPFSGKKSTSAMIDFEMSLSCENALTEMKFILKEYEKKVLGMNIMLFNSSWITNISNYEKLYNFLS